MPTIDDPFSIQDPRSNDRRILDYARRREMARDVTARQRAVQEATEDSSFLENVAKVGLLAVGAYFLGRKAFQTDAVMETVHALGLGARKVGEPAAKFTRGLVDYYTGSNAAKGTKFQTYWDHFELLERFAKSEQTVRQVEAQAGGRIVSGNVAHQVEIDQIVRKGLRQHGFEDLGSAATDRYRPMTVGDVLDSQDLQKAIGSENWSVLQRGWKGGQGALSRGMPLERGKIGGAFVRNMRGAQPGFVDARWLNPKYIARGAYNAASNLVVPFFGFRPVDLIAHVMRPFSEGEFSGMVAPNSIVGKDPLTGKLIRTGKGINAMFGGTLYQRRGPSGGWDEVASNLRLFKRSGVGDARLYRYGKAGDLAPELTKAVESGDATWWQRFKHKVGIGKEYRTQDFAGKTLVRDPMRRKEAVVRGEARVELHENIPASATASWGQKAQAQQAGATEMLSGAVTQDPEAKLSWWERFKAYFGKSDRATVARPGSGRLSERAVVGGTDEGFASATMGRKNLTGRRVTVRGEEPVRPTRFGEVSDIPTTPIGTWVGAGRGQGISVDPMGWLRGQTESLVDVTGYMTTRLNDLMGWTAGIGFRPTMGSGILGGLGAVGGNLAKIYGAYYGAEAAVGYLNYADYLFESTIGKALPEGYDSPKKLAIRLYQGAQITRSYIKDTLGVTAAASYLEDLMPGSIDSGASWTARTVAPFAAGVALKGKLGALAGLGAALIVGGNDIRESADDTLAYFRGDKDVAVRKSRWWMLGRQPFEGGQIDYFKKHWTVEELSDYRFTDVQYGGKAEYYENVSRLPTFHNFFGLKTFFQDGGPVSGGDRYLAKKHAATRPYPNSPGVDYEKSVRAAQLLASRGPYDAPFGAGQRLGYGTMGGLGPRPDEPSTMLGGVKHMADQVTELGGIYKFLLGDLPKPDSSVKMADYRTIGSKSREFYDASVGGLMGMTELYRRFVLSQDARQGINPVPNQMPSWLPGMRSDFKEDQVQPNRFDYTLGDPYAKIPKGEARLPGTGYEALHRLHSGTPGVYDAMDRFLILADVAPTSQAFKQYSSIVESWQKAGVLDASWSDRFDTGKEQVKQKMERYQFAHRRFTGIITDPDPDGTRKRYGMLERGVGAAWEILTHDVVPKIGDAVPLLGPLVAEKGLQKLSPIEHYIRYQVNGEEFADWRSPYKSFVRHKWSNIVGQDPMSAGIEGGMTVGLLMSGTPVGAMLGATLGAGLFAGGSMARHLDDNMVPDFRDRERELSQWFDTFGYVKNTMLEARANVVGDRDLVDYYTKQKKRTITSLDYGAQSPKFTTAAMKAMGRQNRSYFMDFMNMPSDAQDAVMPYMPANMRPVLLQASGRLGQPQFDHYRKQAQMGANTRAASFMAAAGGMPENTWAGWHPDVPMDAVKIRFLDSNVNSVAADIHKFDLYAEHRFRGSAWDDLPIPVGSLENVNESLDATANLEQDLMDAGFNNVQFRYSMGTGHNVNWNFVDTKIDSVRRFIGGILR